MKPIEIVLSSEGGRWGRIMDGVNLTNIYYSHTCKYHSVFPIQILHANKINF
jgi:hypothetical protein